MPSLAPVDILVVDDNEANLTSLSAILAEPGRNLILARSGGEALRALLEREFALLILDVQMPILDGFETAALIRERERTRHIPIIFLTAHQADDVKLRRGYALGAVDFMFKPIVPEILQSKVNVFVELHRRRDELAHKEQQLREAQRREHEQHLAEVRQRWEAESLRAEMERERRIAEELTRNNSRLQLLSDAASRLLRADPRRELPKLLLDLSAHLGLEVHVLCALEPGAPEPRVAPQIWAGVGEEEAARMLVDSGLTRFVAENLQDAAVEPLSDPLRDLGLSAFAQLPLLADGRVTGAITFASRRRRRFAEGELALLRVVSDQVAMALDRARLIAELREQAVELAEADRKKTEFLAILAHELRNPLTPMLYALQLMRARGSDDPMLIRTRDTVERQVRHMTRLVDDLLDVSRVTNGKIELRKEVVDLSDVLDHAVQIARPIVEERGHTLVFTPPQGQVLLSVDPTRVAQVVANLLNNAAKFTDAGGRIELHATCGGGEAVIVVRDNGRGIEPAMLPRVFDLFVQTSESDRAAGGLGIGLTLVKRLVELHGGRVAVASDGVGKGTEFTIHLPAEVVETRAARPDLAAGSAPSTQTAAQPLHVLVVEDNPDIRDTLKDLLELFGHHVDVAEDGARGIEKAVSLNPRVVLVDIGMPGVDGYTVARSIREQRKNGNGPRLIAITGYGQPEDRRRAIEAGFDAHLVKPVDPTTLERLLAEQQ